MSLRHLDSLFRPKSVAFIGASNEPGRVGSVVIRNLLSGGFDGPIMPVTRRFRSVAGVLAYSDVASLPMAPDMAVIGTPPEPVPELIAALGGRGTRAAIVLTAGMSNTVDASGRTTQAAMLEAAKQSNVRILGPNSLGLLVPGIGLNASFSHQPALAGNIAFVSQSGALCTAVLDWARGKGIGFSHFVSVGDCAEIGFAEVLDYLATDSSTRAILLYIEAIHDRRHFMSAARATARIKPVLAIKAGRVAESIRAAVSHVGARAGSDAVYDAAFRRAGMLRVFDTEELFAAVETLARSRALKGEGLAIVTNGGGIGIMSVDALIQGGGRLASLSEETMSALDGVLPDIWARGNPVDMIGDATGKRYADTLRILLQADEVDAVMVLHAPTAVASSVEAAEAVIEAVREHPGNVLTCWVGEEAVAPARRLFADAGIPSYESPNLAIRAFLHMVDYRRNQELLMQTPRSVPIEFIPSMDVARAAIQEVLDTGGSILSDPQAKVVLAAYGVPVVPTRFASDPEEAASQAKEVGFPVALKLLLSEAGARRDVSGVVLDLSSEEAVREAADRMLGGRGVLAAEVRSVGFSVQRMVSHAGAHELMLGVETDPVFGPVLVFGQGGAASDIIGDRAVALPPLNLHLARELISRTRIFSVLQGYRGHEAVDIDAVCLTLVKLSQLVIDIPHVTAVSINPLIADDKGVLAVETNIRVRAVPPPAGERLAIRPYPQELEEDFTLTSGLSVRLRPIRPEDEPAHYEFLSKLSANDIRLRFFGTVGELPHSEMARLTQIDYDREMAFVATAIDERGEVETLGDIRTMTDPDNDTAEYSIMVRSDLKGTGLGRKLMEKMIGYCRDRGTRRFFGQVLQDNSAMLGLIDAMGFECRLAPNDTEVYEVWCDLQEG